MKFIGTKKIETERLILRRIKSSDIQKAYDNWCSNYNVTKYMTWDKHKDVSETALLFHSWILNYEKPETFKWIVEIKDTHEVIGTIDAFGNLMKYGTCEIGYCYGEKYWNKGYGTEALKGVIKFLFEECDAYIIWAEHLRNNPASGKVMEKAGLKYEATLRSRGIDKDNIRNDLLVYSLTKDEYLESLK